MKKGWEIKKLGELSKKKDAVVSGPFGSNLKVTDYKDEGIPILRLQNIGKGYFIDKSIKFITERKAEELKYHSFNSGDIALAKLGIPIGKTCIIPDHFKSGIITADIVRIRPDKQVANFKFLEYFLNTDLSVSQLTGNISGATRPRVNLSDVRNIEIPLPPLPEQQRIVAILDEAFAAIAKAKANAEQNLKNAKEFFESYLQGVFEQRGEGWEGKTLNQISENLDSKRIPITKNSRIEGLVPYYGASGIVDYVANFLFNGNYLAAAFGDC
jgi:type I restriction enzyme, S subunit